MNDLIISPLTLKLAGNADFILPLSLLIAMVSVCSMIPIIFKIISDDCSKLRRKSILMICQIFLIFICVLAWLFYPSITYCKRLMRMRGVPEDTIQSIFINEIPTTEDKDVS